jgi:membrane protease YdiL (CAAX protease family)
MAAGAVVLLRRRSWGAYGLVLFAWPQELRVAMTNATSRLRVSEIGGWALLGAWLLACLGVGLHGRSLGQLAWLVAWQFFATAIGEEVFFRGYVQTRLNGVFSRSCSVRGVLCGWGLVVMAVLFGALYAFNTVDYFGGRFTFAWSLAVGTAGTGLLFGWVREATGSVAPGIVLHFMNNLTWITLLPEISERWIGRP